MARTATARSIVALPPTDAQALWTDLGRWPTFVEGFAKIEEASPDWPGEGAKVVWRSIAGGRGRVTEIVRKQVLGEFVTEVYEDALQGTQTAVFHTADQGGTELVLSLEYELTRSDPLHAVADVLFIRRAQRDALARTLRRFRVEAEEEAALR